MESIRCLLQAVGIKQHEADMLTPWILRSQIAFKHFFSMYMKRSVNATRYPIARPQLIRVNHSMDDLMTNRIMWVWAATWTLRNAIIDELKPKGYMLGVCVNCALYTGCFCDDCDGAICTKCDDEFDQEGRHKCQFCIEIRQAKTKTMSK